MSAHSDGAINGREAHAILHPLHHQIAECMAVIHQRAEGLMDKRTHFSWEQHNHDMMQKRSGRNSMLTNMRMSLASMIDGDQQSLRPVASTFTTRRRSTPRRVERAAHRSQGQLSSPQGYT